MRCDGQTQIDPGVWPKEPSWLREQGIILIPDGRDNSGLIAAASTECCFFIGDQASDKNKEMVSRMRKIPDFGLTFYIATRVAPQETTSAEIVTADKTAFQLCIVSKCFFT